MNNYTDMVPFPNSEDRHFFHWFFFVRFGNETIQQQKWNNETIYRKEHLFKYILIYHIHINNIKHIVYWYRYIPPFYFLRNSPNRNRTICTTHYLSRYRNAVGIWKSLEFHVSVPKLNINSQHLSRIPSKSVLTFTTRSNIIQKKKGNLNTDCVFRLPNINWSKWKIRLHNSMRSHTMHIGAPSK